MSHYGVLFKQCQDQLAVMNGQLNELLRREAEASARERDAMKKTVEHQQSVERAVAEGYAVLKHMQQTNVFSHLNNNCRSSVLRLNSKQQSGVVKLIALRKTQPLSVPHWSQPEMRLHRFLLVSDSRRSG